MGHHDGGSRICLMDALLNQIHSAVKNLNRNLRKALKSEFGQVGLHPDKYAYSKLLTARGSHDDEGSSF